MLESDVPVEESMLFLINEDSATKILKKKRWAHFIRLMNNQGEVRKEGCGNHHADYN